MLSEKAKGKQRAVDIPSSPNPVRARDLVVRFTDGSPDVTVSVNERDTLHDVKDNIRKQKPHLATRRLRFIYSGAIIPDPTVVNDWLAALETKLRKTAAGQDAIEQSPPLALTWIHCSVGREIEAGEEEAADEQKAQLQPARGFDRLASVGFSAADIANFRQQFHSQSASSNYLDTDFETEEEYDEHARALEEEWIDSLDNAGSATLSQNSSAGNPAFLQGMVLGFFFPILPFFFFRNSQAPVFWADGSGVEPTGNVIFSKYMQMGLIVGFLINLLFGTWRYLLDAQ